MPLPNSSTGSATAKLKKAPAPAASSSCASRPPKNPSMRGLPKGRKMIAAGRGLVRIANQLAVHWQPLRLIDRHDHRVCGGDDQAICFGQAIIILVYVPLLTFTGVEGK